MDCFRCLMLVRENGLRNFCDFEKRQRNLKELTKSCKHFMTRRHERIKTTNFDETGKDVSRFLPISVFQPKAK